MTSPVSIPAKSNPRRTGLRGAAAAGLAILVFGAVVFATSTATSDAAHDGLAAQSSEALVGSGDLAVKALAQAVLLAEDEQLGTADTATVAAAVGEAKATLEDLARLGADTALLLDSRAVGEAAAAAAGAGRAVVSLLESERVLEAGSLLAGDARAAFEALRDLAAAERDTHTTALASVDSLASKVGLLASFLIALLLPLGVIVAYRFAARRQLRLAEVQLDARIGAEHEVIRAKDEFIANMSHELRTPLTSIYGFSELLLESGLLDPESSLDLIGMINSESAELGRMIEDLLVAARVDSGGLVYSFEETDVAAEIEQVIAPLARDGMDVNVDVPARRIWADPLRVRQIARNLVSNAIRYGGETIRIHGTVARDRLEVTVADDGGGVSAEMEPRLFSRFVHDGDTALTVGSVGLGLAVVASLCDDMNGTIEYAREGGWTRFTFSLPTTSAAAAADGAADAETSASAPVGASLAVGARADGGPSG